MSDKHVEIQKTAEAGELDKMKTALSAIPPEEHLAIIRALKTTEQGNPNLTIDIDPASSDKDYKYKVTYKGPNSPKSIEVPAGMNAEMAKIMGITPDQLKKQLEDAQGGAGPKPMVLEEQYKANQLHVIKADKKL